MNVIRQATANDYIEGYPPLSQATRAMLARRANLRPGTTVAALRVRQVAANIRLMKHGAPKALEEPTIYAPTAHTVRCETIPHDPTLLELQGTFMDSDEFGESVRQYIAGNVNHPLVSKFGWGKDSKLRAS